MDWVLGIVLLIIVAASALVSVLHGLHRVLESGTDRPLPQLGKPGRDRSAPA